MKARLWIEGRKETMQNVKNGTLHYKKPTLLFHAASLGEYEQCIPLIEQIKKCFPNKYSIVVSFYSPSGYEVRKNHSLADQIIYLPFDFREHISTFLNTLKPSFIFLAKYEFWHHLISEAHKRKIPIFSFSTILRKEQVFFKSYGSFFKKALTKVNYFFVQNEETGALLTSIGCSTKLVGDTRFDRVMSIANKRQHLETIIQFKNKKRLIVIGSSWPKDLEYLIPYINQSSQELKFIIAPHNIDAKQIDEFKKQIEANSQLYSTFKLNKESKVLFIDNIGMLSSIYAYADIAYIGGAFGSGLHNILEAAVYHIPVVFGPKYRKFQEAKDLVQLGGAFSVNDYANLKKTLDSLLLNKDTYNEASNASKRYIEKHVGATEKIMMHISPLLSQS